MSEDLLNLTVGLGQSVPVEPAGGTATITVTSGSTVYYRDHLPVSASLNDGSIAVSGSQAFTHAVWLASAGTSAVSVTTVTGSGTSPQDITLGTDGLVGGPGGTQLTSPAAYAASAEVIAAPPSGGDDTTALQTLLTALTAGKVLKLQSGGTYQVTATLNAPAIDDLRIDGNGATIQATGAIAGPILKTPVGTLINRPVIRNLTLDCNAQARNGLALSYFAHASLIDVEVWSPTQHAVIVGDTGAASSSFELMGRNLHVWRPQASSVPAGYYGLWMSNVSDSEIVQAIIVGMDVGIRNDGASNKFSHCHAWGYSGKNPTVCFDDNSSGASYVNCAADTPTTYGYRLRTAGSTIIGGQVFNGTFGGTDNVVVGIQCDPNTVTLDVIGVKFGGADNTHRIAKSVNFTNLSRGVIVGNTYSNVVTASQSILQIDGSSVGFQGRDASGTTFFVTQGGNKSAQVWNGGALFGYSDGGSTQTFKLDAATGAATFASATVNGVDVLAGQGTWQQQVLLMATPYAVVQGTWGKSFSTGAYWNGFNSNSTNAQNDGATWSTVLGAGTYTFDFFGSGSTGTGAIATLDYSQDGGSTWHTIGTVDTYLASAGSVQATAGSGIVVAGSGQTLVRARALTRNVSSTGWQLRLTALIANRTA